MTPEGLALLAKMRAADAAELERCLNTGEQDKPPVGTCAACGRLYHTGLYARKAVWSPQHGAYFHALCLQGQHERLGR